MSHLLSIRNDQKQKQSGNANTTSPHLLFLRKRNEGKSAELAEFQNENVKENGNEFSLVSLSLQLPIPSS
jgi:hypothetical protein